MILKILKLGWSGAMILILVITLYFFDDKPNNDIGKFFSSATLLFTFPIGLIPALIHYIVIYEFLIEVPSTYLSLILYWAVLFILGYFQWFKLVPSMILKILKLGWSGTMILILAITLYFFDDKPNNDIGIFFVWTTLFCTFPIGLIPALIYTMVSEFLDKELLPPYFFFTLYWTALFILGYFQWFKLVPWLIIKIRKKFGPSLKKTHGPKT